MANNDKKRKTAGLNDITLGEWMAQRDRIISSGKFDELDKMPPPPRGRHSRKIEVFEITSKNDKIYKELLEQYKINERIQALLNEPIFVSKMILAGDFRLITMMNFAIDMDDITVYLVKDIDNDVFLLVMGKFMDGKISIYPLQKKLSKNQQLAIRSALVEKGLLEVPHAKLD
jgi:hypothetical protein